MHRKACAVVLLLAPCVMGAGRIDTAVTLHRTGQGDVTVEIETNLDEMKRLAARARPEVKASFLLRQAAADPAELIELLSAQGMSGVGVTQSTKGGRQLTKATAQISDVRALTGHGGELMFNETEEGDLELKGSLGGALSGENFDLSPLADLEVSLTITFPGAVRRDKHETADAGKFSHSGRAVTYRWKGDKLLGGPTPVHVRVVPDIEGTPYFWLALILGVTALVVLGAAIVMHRGRETLKPAAKKP